jgi:methionine sulfoxide reductase heme-binding subunit
MSDTSFQRRLIAFCALIPAGLMAWDWQQGNLGVNPVEFVTRATGVLTLIFLVLTLAVTPLKELLRWTWLVKHRRLLGLVAFAYAFAHLVTYVAFDRDWKLDTIPLDVWRRPFIALGMFSFLLMIPLAATSTNRIIRKMGQEKWRLLHRLTYYIAIGGVLHYWMIVKSDITYPLLFAILVGLLLGYRLMRWILKRNRSALNTPTRPS